jgi:hypothetical protein
MNPLATLGPLDRGRLVLAMLATEDEARSSDSAPPSMTSRPIRGPSCLSTASLGPPSGRPRGRTAGR